MLIQDAVYLGQRPARAGRHRLAGTVSVDGKPARRLVSVLDRRDFTWLAGTWSEAESGVWQVYGLAEYPEQSLLVIALDKDGAYNAEVADYISQAGGETEEDTESF